jgi:hypothetical protein
MNSTQARTIPIDLYLSSQGIKAAKSGKGGRELWYSSPIRNGDKTPSFKIDTQKQLWYDHGLDKGGNIIDLVCELCSCNVRDALRHLEKTNLFSAGGYTHKTAPALLGTQKIGTDAQTGLNSGNKLAGQKEKDTSRALILISASPLKHPALLQYLQKREIDTNIATKYLSQIDFKPPQGAGNYFALGYPAGDGFEARNALFKGFVGIGKNVTFHKGSNQTKLMIFEGFTDFLSYLTMKNLNKPDGDVLVLNSTALKTRALPYLQNPQYEEIQLFLDNDEPGNICAAYFLNAAKTENIADMRSHYPKHNDLNEWHCDRKL